MPRRRGDPAQQQKCLTPSHDKDEIKPRGFIKVKFAVERGLRGYPEREVSFPANLDVG